MFIKNYFLEKFLTKLPPQKVFIIPTIEGLIFSFSTVVIILIGIVFSNNSILLIGFILLILIVLHTFYTNNNLENLNVDEFRNHIDGRSSFVVNILSGNLENKRSIDFQLQLEGQESLDQHMKTLRDSVNISLESLPRGFYKIKRLRLSSSYPLGLFFAWKFFSPSQKSLFSFPELEGKSLKEKKQKMKLIEQGENLLSSDQKYKEHRKYDEGDNTSSIDWSRYAKDRSLYVKKFESNESEEISFSSNAHMSEKEISQIALWIEECHLAKKTWHYQSERVNFKNLSSKEDFERCLKDLTLT